MSDSRTITTTDVLIIGGGWTGVAAARELFDRNEEARSKGLPTVEFRLLEADPERLGGRAFSYGYRPSGEEGPELRYEHGAQYIGNQQTEIWKLANHYMGNHIVDGYQKRIDYQNQVMVLAQKRYCYNRADCLFGIGGVPPGMGFWDILGALVLVGELNTLTAAINIVEPWNSPTWVQPLDGITMKDWTDQPWITPTARDLITVAVQAVLSVEMDQISAFYFLWYTACNGGFLTEVNDEENGPQQYYLSCGFDRLVARVAADFSDRIVYGSQVQTIDLCDEGGVVVTTCDGEKWIAKTVIVAMSPSTSGRIDYAPAVPPQRAALMEQRIGRTVKCQVFYKEAWWNDSHAQRYTGYAGAASSPVSWIMDYTQVKDGVSVPALMTFTVGDFADELGATPSKEAVISRVTKGIAFLFNDTRALADSGCFVDLVFYDWSQQDQIAGGGPNTVFGVNVLTGADCPARLLNQPWDDKVFFAAAETARKLDPASNNPYGNAETMQFSDMRQSLGYMDGAICSGRFVANQVLKALHLPYDPGVDLQPSGDPPPPPPPGSEDIVPCTRSQIIKALDTLCALLYGASAPKLELWQKEQWSPNHEALMGWIQAQVLPQALEASSIPNVQSLIYWGHTYSASCDVDPETVSIQKLTAIVNSMVGLLSSEPYILLGVAQRPPVRAVRFGCGSQ